MDLIVVELGWREVEKVRQRMRVNDIVFAWAFGAWKKITRASPLGF